MKKGYCIDCKGIAWIKAKNRCEHHYRLLHYKLNRDRALAYAKISNKRAQIARTKRRISMLTKLFNQHGDAYIWLNEQIDVLMDRLQKQQKELKYAKRDYQSQWGYYEQKE